ncbi:hypothetical protein ACQR16_02080 [Bradyrhizobium oligotrophicum]|uniref:hypothetical protein n=1 Tax=Bradyrhizobium oligotrophicum TaxID=44255 RepID=UPI003EBABEDF
MGFLLIVLVDASMSGRCTRDKGRGLAASDKSLPHLLNLPSCGTGVPPGEKTDGKGDGGTVPRE